VRDGGGSGGGVVVDWRREHRTPGEKLVRRRIGKVGGGKNTK